MNAYRFNQIAMAVLGALLLFFGARTIINIAFEEQRKSLATTFPGTEAGKPGGEKAGGRDRSGSPASQGQRGEGHRGREEMRALPQFREGRSQHDRAEPL